MKLFETVRNGTYDAWQSVKSRGNEALQTGKLTGMEAGYTLRGVVASVASVCTLGLSAKINSYAEETYHSENILPSLFTGTVRVFKPSFTAGVVVNETKLGFITKKVAQPIFTATNEAKKNSNYLKRHTYARIGAALGAVVGTASSVADLAVGIFAAACSIVTLGKFVKLNSFAAHQLQSLGLIHHFCSGIRHTVYPFQSKRV